MSSVIDRIQSHAKKIATSKDPAVMPGRPEKFTDASSPGDTIAQGDLYLMIVDEVPGGYHKVTKPRATDKQLVPGNTQGAKHCLSNIRTVELYHPADWGKGESLVGPCFRTKSEVEVLHPVHGDTTIPAGFTVLCGYQPEFDAELRRERRNAD
jgi:hypothetical protein